MASAVILSGFHLLQLVLDSAAHGILILICPFLSTGETRAVGTEIFVRDTREVKVSLDDPMRPRVELPFYEVAGVGIRPVGLYSVFFVLEIIS